ncbi:MAG: hypothetical protein J7J57_05175 [Caldisericaceae bacterium]|nr:hypothetical protein [Caldisericaceae bacterium]
MIALVVIFVAGYSVAEIIAEDAVKRLAKDFFLIISGDMQNSTLGVLYKMIIFPKNSLKVFFGDVSTYSINRISSDIGYIRVLNSIGFFGAMAYYFFWLIVSYKIVKNIPDKVLKKNMTSFLVVVFVLEAKEPFFSYLFVAVLILTFYVLLVMRPRLKVNAYE